MQSTLRKNKRGPLPRSYDTAHDLCFVMHDILVQLLKSGEEGNFFRTSVTFKDEADRIAFNEAPDIFEWLEQTRRVDDRAAILVTTVFPAVLSDTLHCFYEALESSRKAKLNITYMLIRKPLQENLFLLESVVIDRMEFAEKLATEPMKLRGLKAGGVEVHKGRIQKALEIIGETNRLSAAYLAQLRYDKTSDDGFDGICNHAMHLFTEHEAIRTDPMNINFVFSGWEEKLSQWSYLYSRLPYLLFYVRRLVEHIASRIAPTHPEYLNDMERRVSALIILWWETVDDAYKAEPLETFVLETSRWLMEHCRGAGFRTPTKKDLIRMSRTGAYPGEALARVKARDLRYGVLALINRITRERAT